MVNDQLSRRICYQPMHIQKSIALVSAPIEPGRLFVGEPFVLPQPIVIGCIDDGDLALRQGYESYIAIGWLTDGRFTIFLFL